MDTHQPAVLTKKVFGEVMLVPPDTAVFPHGYVAAQCSYSSDGVRWGSVHFGLTLSHVHLKREVKRSKDAEVTFGKNEGKKCLSWEKVIEVPEVRKQVISVQQALAELCSFMLESYGKGEVSESVCLDFLKKKGVPFG
jgi:hypothetical protein